MNPLRPYKVKTVVSAIVLLATSLGAISDITPSHAALDANIVVKGKTQGSVKGTSQKKPTTVFTHIQTKVLSIPQPSPSPSPKS